MKWGAVGLLIPLGLVLTTGRAGGDVFVLAHGGRLEGELLNPEEKPRKTYSIRTTDGASLTLTAAQVQQVVAVRAEEREYEKIRHRYPDTVEGQWALAEWCRQQKLFTQRDTHLERLIELDPNHAEARRALGYSQVNGKWAKQDDVMTQRGFIRYKGRWRTRQEIELMEGQRKQELAEKDWFQKVDRWRSWLGTDRSGAAEESILGIEDPAAVKALAAGLRNDGRQAVRTLMIEALANLGTREALGVLAATAVDDGDQEIRLSCLDYLAKKKDPDAVKFFVGRLRSKDNVMVNRAGIALGSMKDPSAVGPLIDALVTTHKFKVSSTNPGSISTTFGTGPGSSGGGGLSVGGGPKIVTQAMTNQSVLDALVALTGVNFNFDERAWKYWYASQKRPENLDARRN